jgi:hypothetical protein
MTSGHLVIGSSGDKNPFSRELLISDDPMTMTRSPDLPMSLFLNPFVDKHAAAALF